MRGRRVLTEGPEDPCPRLARIARGPASLCPGPAPEGCVLVAVARIAAGAGHSYRAVAIAGADPRDLEPVDSGDLVCYLIVPAADLDRAFPGP